MSVTLIVFSAGGMDDPAERLVTQARHAITADVVARARQVSVIDRIIVGADSRELIETLRPYDVIADYDDTLKPFAFGTRLAQIIERYGVDKPFYIGGGAGGLLTRDELRGIAEQLHAADHILIPNNLFSSDFVAFTPGRLALDLPPLDNDNNLAFLLRTQQQMPYVALPRTVGTQFDVDTPIDVLLLGYGNNPGEHVRSFLASAQLDTRPIARLLPHLTRFESELFVFGRVSAEVWLHFERNVICQKRLLSEERGMIANGREARGVVRSLMGYLFDAVGPERAFEWLATTCSAALIDTRVLLAHRRIRASAHDRFNADLFRPDLIHDTWLRDFTRAAMNAPIPILLGGHSLTCGGLYLLAEAARREFPPPPTDARRANG